MGRKTYIKVIIFISVVIHFSMQSQPVYAQNYNEVNVYGWGEAINEAAPAFLDIDHDGYMDMLVGNKFWYHLAL